MLKELHRQDATPEADGKHEPGLGLAILKVIVSGLKVAAALIRWLPSIIGVMMARRSIRIADEKRRLALRWKPEGGRQP